MSYTDSKLRFMPLGNNEEKLRMHNHQDEESCLPKSSVFQRLLREKGWLTRWIRCAVLVTLILFALFHAGGGSSTIKQKLSFATDGLEPVLGPKIARDEGFIIMVPTYKHPEMLPSFLDTYATGNIPSLRAIIIMWYDNTTLPSGDLVDSLDGYPVPIHFEPREVSLNERFRISKHVTTNCVLAIDDGMRYNTNDVELAYQVWKEFGQGRKRMVGYIPREVTERTYVVGGLQSYSIVLTKSAFFHTDWLNAYWSPDARMTAMRAYVDENRNCEDLLMSFLVARYTRIGPIYVDAMFEDKGLWNGISTVAGHVDHRTECVRKFLDAFGEDALVSSTFVVKSL